MKKPIENLFVSGRASNGKTTAGDSYRFAEVVPPKIAAKSHKVIHQGVTMSDDYNWLRNPDYPTLPLPPEIQSVLEAENDYCDKVLAHLQPLKQTLFSEMQARLIREKFTVPAKLGSYFYYSQYRTENDGEMAEHPSFYRLTDWQAHDCTDGIHGSDNAKMLFNANQRSKSFDYYDLAAFEPSPNGRWIALCEDIDGSENHQILLLDTQNNRLSAVIAAQASGELVWSADSGAIYYLELDEHHRATQLKLIDLSRFTQIEAPKGSDQTAAIDPELLPPARLIYQEFDNSYSLSLESGISGRLLYLTASARESSECHWLDLRDPQAILRCAVLRREGHIYSLNDQFYQANPTDSKARFLILTNDKHHNFRVCTAEMEAAQEENWREVIAPSDSVYLTDIVALDRWWALQSSVDGLPEIRVFTPVAGAEGVGENLNSKGLISGEQTIHFPDATFSVQIGEMNEGDLHVLRLHYSSPIVPPRVYDYCPRSQELRQLQFESVPNHQPENYRLERLWIECPKNDGEPMTMVKVPVTVISLREQKLPAPIVLYGYGAYGYGLEDNFSAQRFSLIDRGIQWATAHVRGGDELGWRWYEDGKLDKKTNSFSDFIAIAEGLVQREITSHGKIVTMGGSAGGLLVGASLNLAPADLFAAAVLQVPFVDIVNTMLDETLPLTPGEYMEWGNPNDAEVFRLMLAYSPYDNLAARDYPPLYLSAGLSDPRVTYWEPAKYLAKLRSLATNCGAANAPWLLRTYMNAGHGGASGRNAALKELAEEYCFILAAFDNGKF